MSGIVINIDPVILRLGDFELRWYTVAMILAVAAAALIAAREGKETGLPLDIFFSFLPWAVIGGIVGARLLHVVDHWSYYAANPVQIFQLHHGGLAIWGALIGGAAAVILHPRSRHIPLGRLGDIVVPALLVAQMLGRLGCIINGDAYGSVTSLPWGFVYIHPNALIPDYLLGMPTHPYPVYEIIWNALVLLLTLRFRHRFKQDGQLFLSYLSLYSLGRLVLSFVRQEKTIVGELQQAQVVSVGILIVSVAMFIYSFRKARHGIDTKSEGAF